MPNRSLIDLPAGPGRDASPEHRRFRQLRARLDQARGRLQAWQQAVPEFARHHAELVQPIERRVDALTREFAFQLDRLLQARRWNAAERQTLARMIRGLCERLIGAHGDAAPVTAGLKALHDRHAPVGWDEREARALRSMRSMLEAHTGLDLGDAGEAGGVDELLERTRAALAAREQSGATADDPRPARADGARPTPRPGAAARRAEADAAAATQTLREVYRKLAAALHPDRTPPDAPPAERERRSQGMARANAAHEAGDLLALLQLQLELEQIDPAQAGRLAAAQLRHVNRVLAGQLDEIEQDIRERENQFRASYGVPQAVPTDPHDLAPLLLGPVASLLQDELGIREQRLALVVDDPAEARALLRALRTAFRRADRDDG